MLKKLIKYTDYDGNEREETYFFNLSRAEVTEMEMSVNGGLVQMMERIVQTRSEPELIKLFKDIILKSYGEKSADGKYFVKNQQLRDAFSQTEAYTNLFMELATDATAAAAFFNGIIPPAPSKN